MSVTANASDYKPHPRDAGTVTLRRGTGTASEATPLWQGGTESARTSSRISSERESALWKRPPAFPHVGAIDGDLLRQASEIASNLEPEDEFNTQLQLDSLKGLVADMWKSADAAGELCQDVLAILENGVRQAALLGTVNMGQAAAFREALTYLGKTALVKTQADVLRSEFVQQGFRALGFADSDVDEAE